MTNRRSGGSGCAMILVVMLVVGAVLWGIAILLNVLGFLLLFGGPVVGLIVIGHGWNGVLRGRKTQRRTQELREMAADARRDLGDVMIELDYLTMTKGIGTPLTESDQAALVRLRAKAEAAAELLDVAGTPYQLRETVADAEHIRLQARHLTD